MKALGNHPWAPTQLSTAFEYAINSKDVRIVEYFMEVKFKGRVKEKILLLAVKRNGESININSVLNTYKLTTPQTILFSTFFFCILQICM